MGRFSQSRCRSYRFLYFLYYAGIARVATRWAFHYKIPTNPGRSTTGFVEQNSLSPGGDPLKTGSRPPVRNAHTPTMVTTVVKPGYVNTPGLELYYVLIRIVLYYVLIQVCIILRIIRPNPPPQTRRHFIICRWKGGCCAIHLSCENI